MNFSWMYHLLVEKANDDSLLVVVEHIEYRERKAFSVKEGAVLRHGA
jgi:hypothetical protein